MSLINDALKKAQHQRTGPMDSPPMPGGGSGGGSRGQGMPTQLVVLLVAGAVMVIAISVITTVYFLNRQPAAPPVAIAAPAPAPAVTTPPPPPATDTAPSPVIIAPVVVRAPTPAPVVETPPEPAHAEEVPGAATATTPAPEPVVEGSLQDRIDTFVDKVRVTGIRTSESGSKVLMNDKVYRLNDVVDRKLGLRLVKIAADSLTFADASGATYVKSF